MTMTTMIPKMKKIICLIRTCYFHLLIFSILFFSLSDLFAQQLAFPGAEGNGRYAKGGRGGKVYEVTNLNDSGEGSLRTAINANGPRIVVFRVSGTIKLKSDLKLKTSNITIAGQTAPGDGICIRDHQFVVEANEVIIRYLRFRLGDETGVDTDAIWGRYRKNIIVDHCSASWSVDEVMSFYANDSMTVQWCLIAESLYMSNHPKGAHGYGGIWGGTNVTFHHNLIAHNSSRTPRFSGGETAACENVDFRNNVIYNWGFNSAYGGEGGKINMVANYYKAGPATKTSVRNRIVQPTDGNGKWYIEANYVDGYPAITKNNWAGGIQGAYAAEKTSRAYTPFPYVPITMQSAEEAYELVLDNVGVNYSTRDTVDKRIINDVKTGTATYDGHAYEIKQGFSDTAVVRGIIDSQKDVGGWPELTSLPAPVDTDHDGMPDEWEKSQGLNPNDDTDRNIIHANGYTMLENYLNSLVDPNPTNIANVFATPGEFTVQQNFPNPFNPNTSLFFTIPEPGMVDMRIYDIMGHVVHDFSKGFYQAGLHSVQWNGREEGGQTVSSGIYFCEFKFRNFRKIIKMQLIR